jgi:hypothetical protein
MAIIQAEQWLDLARQKQPLTTEQRRHVVAYLMSRPGDDCPSISESAELFGVSDRTIANDRKAIREAVAEEVKDEDVGLILADLRLCFNKVMRNIEKSAQKAKLGTMTYLEHQKSSFKLQQDYVKGLQDLGVLPKDLGTLHVEKFQFTASVGMQPPTSASVPVIQGHIVSHPELTNGNENLQNVQYPQASDRGEFSPANRQGELLEETVHGVRTAGEEKELPTAPYCENSAGNAASS